MSSEEELMQRESKRNLKHAFSSLIDTMRDAQRMRESEEKIREIEKTNKRQNDSLGKLKEEFTQVVLSHQETLGKELAESLEKQVSGVIVVAVDLAGKKVGGKYSTELKDSQLVLESESKKTFKSLEAFLATVPFSLLDKSMSLKLLSGAYSANVRYNCEDNIQFEFSLDCKRSAVFNKGFKLTSPEGEVKIPLSLGKSWHKKEPSPDYEGLDRYVLSFAEVTQPHLVSTYEYPEKSSAINMTSSKRDSHASLTVEYQSPDAKINVTSEPALNKFLNSEQIDKSLEALRQSILELENYKVNLVKLISDGAVVFEEGKLDVTLFLEKAWGIIEPQVEAALKEGGVEGNAASYREQSIDQTFVRQKIVSLGEIGNALLVSLKLS
ncbi:MAG: hypothetical protein OK442_03520 [Thaumarchaeota archaeon]|nr:hypothetical protein [Nitrososphaerota archaeon]